MKLTTQVESSVAPTKRIGWRPSSVPRTSRSEGDWSRSSASTRRRTYHPIYLEIRDAERVTRAALAALFYLELRSAFDGVPEGASVIATDIGTNWASTFIRGVLGVGILEVYPNHTFQPQGFVRRLELSEALARALEGFAPEAYRAAMDSSRFEQNFPDLASSNPGYEAAALAVSLGLLMVSENGDFEPQGFVSGAAAVSAVAALAAQLTP